METLSKVKFFFSPLYADDLQTMTITGNGTTTPHATFSWTATGTPPGTYIFYVTYTDNNCPLAGSVTQAITITISPAPTVTFTVISAPTCSAKEAISIIPGGTGSPWNITVTGTTPQTFTGVTTSFIDSLPPGTDTIHISSAAGSTCNTYAIVTVAGSLPITITSSSPTVCAPANGSFTISGLTPGGSYTITYTVGGIVYSSVMVANASGQITVTGLAAGTYTGVQAISTATGCASNIVTFTLTSITITITGTSTNPTVCTPPNGTIILSGLTPGGSYTVYYTVGGTGSSVVMTASASGQITITGLAAGSYTGVYVVSAASGCTSNSLSFTLTGVTFPITGTSTNPTVCSPPDGTITLSGLTPGGSYTIYYTVGGTGYSVVMIANASGQVTITGLATGSYTGVYAVSAATSCVSSSLSFTLTGPTFTITGSPTNPTSCLPPNGVITLSGLTPGGGYTLYYIESGTPHTLVVTANASGQILITGLTSGSYTGVYVVGSASGCTSNTLTFVLTNPNDPPPPVLSSNAPVCADSILLITATDTATSLVYSWTGPNSFTSTLVDPFISNVQTIASGTYSVTITKTTTGCSSSALITITIKPTPAAHVLSGNSPCTGGTLNLSATSVAGCTYSWTGPLSFVSTLQNPSISPVTVSNSGTYTAVATLNGCPSLPGTGTFTVYPTPPAPIVADTAYCQFSTAAPLTAIGSNLLWYTSTTGTGSVIAPVPADTSVGTLTWFVTQTIHGCESPKAPINVTVLYVPSFTIAGNTVVCEGASSTFSYAGPVLNTPTYTWTIPAVATLVSGTVSSNTIGVQFNSSVSQSITLTVSDYNGKCTTTETVPINVVAPPLSTFYVKPDICVGDTVVVALSYRSPSATVFSWNFAGADIIAANSNSGGPFSLSWHDTGLHILSLTTTTDIGCTTPPVFDTTMIHGLPDASIMAPVKGAVCVHDTVILSAMSDRYNNSYTWSPTHFFTYRLDQQSNNNSTIQGVIEYPGYVKLTVTDPFGCTSTDSLYMDPKPCCDVIFPNAFTPNGDTHNDVFRPVFSGYHNFHVFRIVNRWGQTVFETTNTNQAWDGNFGGVPQDMDVYYYYLKYDCGGETREAKGDVTLVR